MSPHSSRSYYLFRVKLSILSAKLSSPTTTYTTTPDSATSLGVATTRNTPTNGVATHWRPSTRTGKATLHPQHSHAWSKKRKP